ncbi:hypothetical protein G7081_00980 [Vagococcus coleopterorum]|uniref:CDP-glycerol glycerophosphotransferase n=1 Tax=Vagococcus coleopterorum TaxID=2714946 RepID=A0A6G8ALC6_9ENTE|nr:CDP-glycerol glycerophosphotransferase family protein [Vagococcus coleopterorum]QIL45762.1 hypothetical protein G7081_00980 [Vagococcus coleopterorum]
MKNIIRRIYKKFRTGKYYFPIMKKVYWFMSRVLPVKSNLIVLESNVGKSIGDSPKDLYDELQSRDNNFKYVWICNNSHYEMGPRTKIVNRLSIKYYYYLARAGYWVNNQNFPTYLTKRQGTKYIQTWHGTPLKKMQNDITNIVGRDATYLDRVNYAVEQWDYLVSPSSYATKCFRSAFKYNKEVIEVGYPRNDIFYKSEVELEQIGEIVKYKLGIQNDTRKVILYAPTFRDDSLNKFDLELDFKKFVDELSDDYILLVRGHVATNQKINVSKQYSLDIIDVATYPSIQELYVISDICITDYSSVMFDFAHTKRPLLFFTYDLEHYQENLRGFYFDFINEAPGPLVRTTEELIETIKDIANNNHAEKYTAFYNKYCSLEDGLSAAKVIDYVFGENGKTNSTNYGKECINREFEKIREYDVRIERGENAIHIQVKNDNRDLVLVNKDKTIVLEKNKANQFVITDIMMMHMQETDMYEVHFFDGNNLRVFNCVGDCLQVVKNDLGEDIGYLFLDNKSQIVISKIKPEKLNSYYKQNKIISMEINQVQDLNIVMEITTKHESIAALTGLMKIRGTEEMQSFSSKIVKCEKNEDTKYITQTIEMTFSVKSFVGDLFDFYMPTIDFYCLINFDEDHGLTHEFRINSPSEKLPTITYTGLNKKILFVLYETLNKKALSARLIEVPLTYYNQVKSSSNELEELPFEILADIKDRCLEQVKDPEVVVTYSKQGIMISKDNSFKGLRLKGNKKMIPMKNQESAFFIKYKDIRRVSNRTGSASIIDESGNPISIGKYTPVNFEDGNYYKFGCNSYSVYKSAKNNLRVGINVEIPSARYLVNQNISEIKSNNGNMEVHIVIRTQWAPIDNISSVLKLRGNKELYINESDLVSAQDLGNGIFENSVILKYSADDIASCANEKERKVYSFDIFDFSFSYSLAGQRLKAVPIRIDYKNLIETSVALDFGNEKLIMFVYPTKVAKKLSAKLTYVETSVYEYYLKSQKVETKENAKLPVILVSEYPHKAQDTGLAYFKYLVDNHSDSYDTYYMISEISKDMKNLSGYEDKLVLYKSKQHVDIFNKADILASSHGTNYLCPVLDVYAKNKLLEKYKIFLQHGILGVRDMSYLYGKDAENPFTNLFIVSSEREKQLVEKDFGYEENEVLVSGLSRFDDLIQKASEVNNEFKKIVIMPTWRESLHNVTAENFQTSEYYKSFSNLLNNSKFRKLAQSNNWEVSFYLHTNFQKFATCFNSNFIKIVKEGEKNVQEFLIESDLLITDYSSVGLDFSLMEKPIIYYQFDEEITNSTNNLVEEFFPGEIVESEEKLIEELETFSRDSKMKAAHFDKLDDLYKYRDTSANDRIYEAMDKRFKRI